MRKVAVLCGGGERMWDELVEARALLGDRHAVVCALNVAGVFVPNLDHWFVTNIIKGISFAAMRESARETDAEYGAIHTPGHSYIPAMVARQQFWPIETKGTIAMFAVRVLSSLGFKRILLAGIPLDDKSGYFYGAPWEKFGMSGEVIAFWEQWAPQLRHVVRSLGGRTMDILGRPTADWLGEESKNET